MLKSLIFLLTSVVTLGSLLAADCQVYESLLDRARDKQNYRKTLSYLKSLEQERPADYCLHYAIGWLYHSLRDHENAREYYEKSIKLAHEAGDAKHEALARTKMAVLYVYRGIPDKALRYLSEIPSLDKKSEEYAAALVTMARTLQDLGDFTNAVKKCQESIDVRREIKSANLWRAYGPMGDIQVALGDNAATWDRAQRAYQEAIASYEQAFNTGAELQPPIFIFLLLGDAYLKKGDPEKALTYYHKLLKMASSTDPRFKEDRSKALGRIGTLFLKSRRYDEAIVYLSQARDIAEEDKNTRLKVSWMKIIADVYAEKGQAYKALKYYEQALDEVTNGFLTLGSKREDERYIYFEEQFGVYEALVELLLKMDKQQPEEEHAKKAFDYVEAARAQSVLQALFQSRVIEKLLEGNITDPFHEKLARLEQTIHSKHRERLEKYEQIEIKKYQNPDDHIRLENEIQKLDADIGDLYRQLVNLIRGKVHNQSKPNIVERIQKEALKENEALIEYMVTNEKTFVFVITKSEFYYDVLPVGRKGYRVTPKGGIEVVEGLTDLLRSVSKSLFPLPDEDAAPRPAIDAHLADIQLLGLHELYERIFQSVENHLPPGCQLIIVPDDVLYYLPFDMLITGFEPRDRPNYLLSRYAISYSYSASLLLDLPKVTSPPDQVLLVGNPDFSGARKLNGGAAGGFEWARFFANGKLPSLPFTQMEVDGIRKVIRNTVLLAGSQATKAAFKRKAAEAGVIHVATHSKYDGRNYLDSPLFFASGEPNGAQGESSVLYLHEIMNLKLRAALVVLTGCETGLGRLRRGGGLEGISRAFFTAQVPSVVGTLWPVEDSKAMPDLMAGFYKYLAKGLNKREALRKAKLDIIAIKPDTDPFYWAAPILIGDAREIKIEEDRRIWIIISAISVAALLLLSYFAPWRRLFWRQRYKGTQSSS